MLDLVEVRDADGEVLLVTGQGQERGLGEAGVRAAVGQAHVAAADLQRRDRDDAAVEDAHVTAPAGELGGGVARLRRVEDDGSLTEVRGLQDGTGRGGEEHDDVGGADRVQVGGRADGHPASGEVAAQRLQPPLVAGDEEQLVGVAVAGRPAWRRWCRRCRWPHDGDAAGARARSSSRTWSWTIAAVKALPLVTAMSVRLRSETPPAVTGAVSAPSPTTDAPRRTAWSTARPTRTRASAGWASMCRAPKGTRTTWPTGIPARCTEAIVTGGTGRRRSATS